MNIKNIPRSIIDIVNISLGIQKKNLITSKFFFMNYKVLDHGIPILIPANKNLYSFNREDIFYLERGKILKAIYKLNDHNYSGFKLSFKQFTFLSNFKLKKKYNFIYKYIFYYNKSAIKKIKNLKIKYKKLGSFQTRNIPHLGHEKIIEMMLERCDHLVINPIIGPKKNGDIKLEKLEYIYKKIISKKFGAKISFIPFFANYFYAGPIEALHHTILRKKLGFSHFSIGRDHAGSECVYKPDQAINFINSLKKKYGINILTHNGAVFCLKCDKIILKGECNHDEACLKDISGSKLRNAIKLGKIYKFANKNIQDFLINNKNIFYDY